MPQGMCNREAYQQCPTTGSIRQSSATYFISAVTRAARLNLSALTASIDCCCCGDCIDVDEVGVDAFNGTESELDVVDIGITKNQQLAGACAVVLPLLLLRVTLRSMERGTVYVVESAR